MEWALRLLSSHRFGEWAIALACYVKRYYLADLAKAASSSSRNEGPPSFTVVLGTGALPLTLEEASRARCVDLDRFAAAFAASLWAMTLAMSGLITIAL